MKKALPLFLIFFLTAVSLTTCKKNNAASDNNKGTCTDGVLNQDETAIDCGGVCSKCPTCSDGVQNQGETGVDCGGPCAKCPIIYPASGFYGLNVLSANNDSLKGSPNPLPYSLRAELPENGSLKVIIKNLSPSSGQWGLEAGAQVGWAVDNYQNNSQSFYASGKTASDLKLKFGGVGIANVEIYEYGASSPTRMKTITWYMHQ